MVPGKIAEIRTLNKFVADEPEALLVTTNNGKGTGYVFSEQVS